MSSSIIRAVNFADTDKIIQIEKENNLSHWSKESYRRELSNKNSIAMCLTISEQITGFLFVRLIITNTLNDSYNEAEILNFGISKSVQNRGFGQKLFDEMLTSLSNLSVKAIWLEVRSSNAQAIRFYKKNDFSVEYERKNYYANPTDDALVMKKTLYIAEE